MKLKLSTTPQAKTRLLRTLPLLVPVLLGLGAAPLAAYVIGAEAVFKRFGDKQAADAPVSGAVIGQATISGPNPAPQPILIQVNSPGDCELVLDPEGADLRGANVKGGLKVDAELPNSLAAFAALGCPFTAFRGIKNSANAQQRIRRLAEDLGVNLKRVSLSHLDRRAAWVVGARSGDLEAPQLWFDKQNNRVIRVIARYDGLLWDLRFKQPASLATAHRAPRVVEVYRKQERHLRMQLMSAEGGGEHGDQGELYQDEEDND